MHSCKPLNHPYLTMSKGNMLLGYARGAVGNLVFSRVKGNEVTKARNRQPANPKTSKQVYQRAKFLNAVNFYKRGVQNLFKFAYEDKTQQESDFNAFMRHNVSRAIPVGKSSSAESVYPAISNWITSVGSLNGPQAVIGHSGGIGIGSALMPTYLYAVGDYNISPVEGGDITPATDAQAGIYISLGSPIEAPTVGKLSAALKTQFPDLLEGDIITMTMITQVIQGIGEPLLLMPSAGGPEGAIAAPAWGFCQFRIDSTSTKTIASALADNTIYLSEGLTFDTTGIENEGWLAINRVKTWLQYYNETIGEPTYDPAVFQYMSSCVAGVITFSRETSSGLRVSTQEFSTSEGYQKLIELSQTTEFTESVLRSWDAADLAILEGGFIKA